MSLLGFSPRPERPRTRAVVSLEPLEGRAMLSHVVAQAHWHRAHTAHVEAWRAPHPPHPGPILNLVGQGFVVKSPRFYPYYSGPKRPELNAAGAKAALDNRGNLHLTGIVVGPVLNSPTKPEQEASYAFLIDRGTPFAVSPFPGRPNLRFDTVVSVNVGQSGVEARVSDIFGFTVLPLDPGSVQLGRDNVKIVLPQSLVTSYGMAGTRAPTVVFAAGAQGTATFASFAPEFRGFPIATNARNPHLF